MKEELYSECDGILFTLREYPVVSEGSLIGRILEMKFNNLYMCSNLIKTLNYWKKEDALMRILEL